MVSLINRGAYDSLYNYRLAWTCTVSPDFGNVKRGLCYHGGVSVISNKGNSAFKTKDVIAYIEMYGKYAIITRINLLANFLKVR